MRVQHCVPVGSAAARLPQGWHSLGHGREMLDGSRSGSMEHQRLLLGHAVPQDEQQPLATRPSNSLDPASPSSGAPRSLEAQAGRLSKQIAVLVVVAAAITAIVLLATGYDFKEAGMDLERLAGAAGPAGPFVFVGVYATATVVFVPASLLTLAAGFLYGPWAGTGIVSVAATLGASLAFLVSRYAARPYLQQRLQGSPKFELIDNKVEKEGFKVVLLLRLSPLLPFSLLNYALGISRVHFWMYCGASWIGMLPGTFAYVWIGSAGRAASEAHSGDLNAAKIALYVVGAIATLWITKILAGIASSALKLDQDTTADEV